jgi:hypothetical protein
MNMSSEFRWPVIFLALALVLASTPSFASTRVAIYAIVDDIAFEPSDFEAERAFISGTFVVPVPVSSGLHQPPARGHLYFSLDAANAGRTRADWQALRAAAGTGQVVGFGQYWMPCSSSPSLAALSPPLRGAATSNCSFDAVVDATDRTRAMPRPYPRPSDEGVVTVFDHSDDLCPRFGKPSVQIVAELREAHSPGSVHEEPPPCTEWIGLLASADLAKAFTLQQRDRDWAEATEALILKRLADANGLQLSDLDVRCRDTVCRIHLAFPSPEYQEATGNRLAADALADLPGFAPGGKIDPHDDAPTIDYYFQRRKPLGPAAPPTE